MDLKLAVALWRLGELTGEDLAAAAADALAEGYDSPSLRVLAGEVRPPLSEAGPLFARSLHELSVEIPGEREAALFVACHYAGDIVAGRVAPYEGACRIYSELFAASGYLPELTPFVALADEYEYREGGKGDGLGPYTRRRAEVEADIVAEARRFLEEAEGSGR